MKPRIALISATTAAIEPAVTALAAEFPEAEPWNIVDDKLLPDAEHHGGVTSSLATRMRQLISYATAGSDAVLLTCSMYGFVAKETKAEVPVFAPDEAAFEEAMTFERLMVVASLESALRDTLHRLGHPDAQGVVAKTDLSAACEPFLSSVDAVLLAQYSLTPSAPKLDVPVIAPPRSAAVKLRSVIQQ